MKVCLILAAAAIANAATPNKAALALLAKASAVFDANQAREVHWNWTALEKRSLTNRSGAVVQTFPSVTAESVLRANGGRCNAVVAWGDGLKPYKASASPDERCRAMDDFRPPFEVRELLRGSQATMGPAEDGGAAILIQPDKARQRSDDSEIRCAASIEATVRLDPTSSFPRSIEGKVTGDGCEQRGAAPMQYGQASSKMMRTAFRKGASFRMTFQLQKDKFANQANSFWICVSQHYAMPWDSDNEVLAYWGRQIPANSAGRQLVKDIATRAREFGADSAVSFGADDH